MAWPQRGCRGGRAGAFPPKLRPVPSWALGCGKTPLLPQGPPGGAPRCAALRGTQPRGAGRARSPSAGPRPGGRPLPQARLGTKRLGTARPGDAEFGQATRARKMRGHRRTPGSGSPRSGHCLIHNFQSGQSPIFIPGRNAIELGLTFRVIAQIGSWELKDACPALF